jgi:DNA-directed RNA polymerase subunit alpha
MNIELKIVVDERPAEDGTLRGTVMLEPLYRGFGHTIGNVLRRILLSRVRGSAVTHVRIEGVNHEFTSLTGLSEDILHVILNLKQLVVKLHSEEPRTLTLRVSGLNTVTAAQIECPSDVEIINPDLEIANLAPDGVLNAEITVSKGYGYVPAEDHDAVTSVDVIPLDSVFTPIKNVAYSVEEVPGPSGQSNDFDRLTMEIWADGSVSIREAIGQAAAQVTEMMNAVVDFTGQKVGVIKTVEEASAVVERKEEDKAVSVSVEELELSVRSYNCLKRANINSLSDLLKLSDFDLMNIKNFGKKSAEEVLDKLETMGYSLRNRESSLSHSMDY